MPSQDPTLAEAIGSFPYRIQLAGGWIDQPFVSALNPAPPGSMVVVSLEPAFHMLDRAGMATGSRKIAMQMWGGLPDRDPGALVEELYAEENKDKAEPSGTQDMIGLIYPGVSRLDYDFTHRGGIFPKHIESNNDPEVARWFESAINVLPVLQRPDGYNPLGIKNLDPAWIEKLSQSGKDCYDSIVSMDLAALGASLNLNMSCWETLLPHTVSHPTIRMDLLALLRHYQSKYAGAMYSGCGGGYLIVASHDPVPGSFRVRVRVS